jgi:hypothetical protein
MNKIDKNELYHHLRDFLKSKGVALEDGSYTKRLEQGCTLLSKAINTTQSGVEHAGGKVRSAVNNIRQSIHEATAPAAKTESSSTKRASRKSDGKRSRRK